MKIRRWDQIFHRPDRFPTADALLLTDPLQCISAPGLYYQSHNKKFLIRSDPAKLFMDFYKKNWLSTTFKQRL